MKTKAKIRGIMNAINWSAVLKVEEKCYCPDPQCSTLVLNECKIVTKSECPVCKKEFCFQCKTRWHAGYRCNESGQLRDENDVLLGRLIEEKKWSRCPNCGHAVERVDGCNDVICRYFNIHCWIFSSTMIYTHETIFRKLYRHGEVNITCFTIEY
ncbi:putative e3 ubiquitin-protein ligase rnf217 [Quercus suber]|uniref:E3 ubiquitin-protein ligase rnf217 n=1 Tax=Quercus suber TaxID=58331 RepID=A0AAW0L618_QUESU